MTRSSFLLSLLCVAAIACNGDDEETPADTGDVAEDTGADGSGAGADVTEDVVETPDWARCSPGELCVLVEPGCCASCDELEMGDLRAVRGQTASINDFVADTCDQEVRVCDGCVSTWDPNLLAICQEDLCHGVDVRDSFFSECATAADCAPRFANCCNCGGDVIALATERFDSYQAAICARLDCPDQCAEEPTGTVDCVAGHCVLTP